MAVLTTAILSLAWGSAALVAPAPLRVRGPVLAASKDDAEMARIRDRASEIIAETSDGAVGENAAAGAFTGALVGGLLGGPLGLIFGYGAGANLGAAGASLPNRLKRWGVDPDLLRQAQVMAEETEDAKKAVAAAEEARDSTRRYETTLRRDRDAAQAAAEDAVRDGDDAAARTHLKARMSLDDRVDRAATATQEAEQRLARVRTDVEYLDQRMSDVTNLMARAIVAAVDGADAVAGVGGSGLPSVEDPLDARFRALEEGRK